MRKESAGLNRNPALPPWEPLFWKCEALHEGIVSETQRF